MVSQRKLEEEIARERDPVVRQQLQELLAKRKRESQATKDAILDTASQVVDTVTKATEMSLFDGYMVLSVVLGVLGIGICVIDGSGVGILLLLGAFFAFGAAMWNRGKK
jgi:hypothetical protein